MGLSRELKLAHIKKTRKEWLSYCAYIGAALFLAAVAAGQPAAAPLAGAAGIGAAYAYPSYRKKEVAGKAEKELPLALRSIATLLAAGMPFERAMKQCCQGTAIGDMLGQALHEAKLGKAMPEALHSLGEAVESRQLQKAMAQLSSAYSKRGSPMQLRKLGEEIAAVQKAAMGEYSGKLVVYSLVFIAISAIVPALFQAYVIVGSSFMAGMVSPEQAFWIAAAGFPAADAAALVLMRLKRPFFA